MPENLMGPALNDSDTISPSTSPSTTPLTSPLTTQNETNQPTTPLTPLEEIKKMLSQMKFTQPETAVENTQYLNVDLIKGSTNDFINYKSNSSDYESELKAHLMLRNPGLQAQHVEMVVAEAKDLMLREYELTQQLPENPAKTVRKNTLLILKKVEERQEMLENQRIESAAIQYNIAEKEFGANYVKNKKAEAEAFIAEQLDIPVDEIRDFTPERYSKLLQSYSRRNSPIQEISAEKKETNNFKEKLKNKFHLI